MSNVEDETTNIPTREERCESQEDIRTDEDCKLCAHRTIPVGKIGNNFTWKLVSCRFSFLFGKICSNPSDSTNIHGFALRK